MDNGKGKQPKEESPEEGNSFMRIKNDNPKWVKKADPRDCSGCVTNFSTGNADKDSSNRNDDVAVAAPVNVDKHWSERCSICGNNFLSLISLFNHYNQRHPQKGAEGSSSVNGGYKPKKMIALWPGNWSRTAKRSEINPLIRAREEVKQAAITLMNMYDLEMENRKLKMFNFKNPLLNYPAIHESEAIRNGKTPAFSENRNPSKIYSFWSDQGSKDRSFKGKASSSHLPKQGISRKMKTAGDNSSPYYYYSPEAQFKCTICYKSFPSYQALGGHRSSHNKPKNLALDMINNNAGIGKALGGGHKRSHWGDANEYVEEIHGSYLEYWNHLKKMKESVEAEHYYNYDQQEDEEMKDQEEDGDDASDRKTTRTF